MKFKKKFQSKPLDWRKSDSKAKRQRNALASRDGDYLATARALMRIANQNQDYVTRQKARSDALYFFHKYGISKKNSKKKK